MKQGIIPGIVAAVVCGAIVIFSSVYEKSIIVIIGISALVGLVIGSVYYILVRKLKTAKPK